MTNLIEWVLYNMLSEIVKLCCTSRTKPSSDVALLMMYVVAKNHNTSISFFIGNYTQE